VLHVGIRPLLPRHERRQWQGRYVGRLAGCQSFGEQLRYLACQWGLPQAAQVVVGDGSPWIWNQAGLHSSRGRQILDWYHASEHIWSSANELYGEGKPAAAAWAKRILKVLYAHGGRLKGLGMRRTPAGAEAILALRVCRFNGQWRELWKSKPLAA